MEDDHAEPVAWRRRMRWEGCNYAAAGHFFVTICVAKRRCVLGRGRPEGVALWPAGRMVGRLWASMPERFQDVRLGPYVVMPNHFHAILVLLDSPERRSGLARCGSVPAVVGAFKSITTRAYAAGARSGRWQNLGGPLWQRGYHDRYVRDEGEWVRIARYIRENPARWAEDRFHPASPSPPDHEPWENP